MLVEVEGCSVLRVGRMECLDNRDGVERGVMMAFWMGAGGRCTSGVCEEALFKRCVGLGLEALIAVIVKCGCKVEL